MIPPYSSIKLFATKIFLKNSRIPLRNFSALWEIKFLTENRDIPPLISKFFSIPELFWKTEGFLYKDFRFRPVRQKNSAKSWCPAPRLCMKIFHKRISLKHHIILQWNISVQPNKNFSAENRDTPLFSIKNFSLPEIFWNTEWFPGDVFSVPWDNKVFRQNRESSPPPLLEFFRYQNSFKLKRGSSTNVIGTVRQQFFKGA